MKSNLNLIHELSGYKTYQCEFNQFSSFVFSLGSDNNYIWLLGIHCLEQNSQLTKLRYYFFDFEEKDQFCVEVEIPSGEKLYSISHLWKNASFYERQLIEQTGLTLKKDYRFKEPVKDDRDYLDLQTVEFPSNLKKNTHLLDLRMDKNKVAKANFRTGFFHIGLEDILSGLDWNLSFQTLENYFPKRGLLWSFLISRGIELKENIEIPDRAKAIRMVTFELNRILDHLLYFDQVAVDFKSAVLIDFTRLWIKKFQSLMISYSGNEFGLNLVRPGGTTLDLSQAWSSRMIDELSMLEKHLVALIKDYLLTFKFNENALSFSLVDKEDVIKWGLTGPVARSVGVNLDLRKRDPFYFYQDVEFDIPMGVQGTLYDLFLVKIEEILQSSRIIVQVLDNLPTGNFISPELPTDFLHNLDQVDEQNYKKSVENYLNFSSLNATAFIESPRGVIGVDLIKSDEKQLVRLLGSHFAEPSYLERFLENKDIMNVFPLWTSMDIDLREVER